MAVPDLMTEKEVAKKLQIPRETLKYWRACRRGPEFSTIGKHVRYTPDAVEQFIASNTQSSARVRRKGD